MSKFHAVLVKLTPYIALIGLGLAVLLLWRYWSPAPVVYEEIPVTVTASPSAALTPGETGPTGPVR